MSTIKSLLKDKKYSSYRFIEGKEYVYCVECEKNVNVRHRHEKQSLNDHIASKNHITKSNRPGQQLVQQRVDSMVKRLEKDGLDNFNIRVTMAFIEANIPLSKLNHPSIKNLFEVTCRQKLYSRQYLQSKYLPALFDEAISDIRKSVGSNYVYFVVDETPDILQRKVVNVLVGILNGTYSRPYLLMMKHFDRAVNSQIINQVLNQACFRLWGENIPFEKVLLVLSDAAAYMKRALGQDSIFTNCLHITCLAHLLHNIAEVIRDKYHLVNELVSLVKRRLACSSNDRNGFVEIVGFLPPKPVITR